MPLDDLNKLKSYEDIIADRIADWESESAADIAREVARIGKMSKEEAEKYDAKKAAKERWKKMIAALAVIIVLDAKDTKRVFKGNYEDWHVKNKALYKRAGKAYKQPRDDKDLQKDIKDAAKQNIKDALNYTDTKALRILDRNGNAIRGQAAIQKAFTEAVDNVRNGSTDFTQAMRQTIEQLGGGGVRVDYGGGITRRLDTVVRQNLMYGLKKANTEYEDKIAKMLGADGYEIDLHANSRPSHVFMQGKQYCIGKTRKIGDRTFIGFEEVDPESPDGLSASEALNDYGCRHYRTPIICGVSEPRWSDADIERSKQEHARVIDIGGVNGNKYFWTQKMRAIETDIRRSKDEINALKALGGNDARIRQLQDRIKVFKAKYDQISDATGIDGDAEWKRRMVKFAKSHSGASGIADGGKSPITPITDAAINSVQKVSISGFTDKQNDYIQEQHKELLRYARDNNNSNEVAFVYRKGLTDRTVFKGSEDVIDFGNGLNGKGDGLFIMHNHPRNSSFSNTDVIEFINENSIKYMSIVKHNGLVEIIEKTSLFDQSKATIEWQRAINKYVTSKNTLEYDKAMERLLNKLSKKEYIKWLE